MKSRITSNKNGIDINITELEGKKEELLEAFQECSEGRCTCPTQEYQKVKTMNVIDMEGTIQLSIKSKTNEVIDTNEIEKCLEYTKNKVSK
ncbi:MAG: hypothetical protein PVJ21_17400 [Anaerolineales bacterium]|jgi:RNase adaptor protein for sRNA GlmZ degradation